MSQRQTVYVKEQSITFAVVTLLFYIFIYPIGLLLNIVGLLTGPRRGCFLSMALLFIILPVVLLVVVVYAGISVGWPMIDQILNELRALLAVHP